MEPDSTPEYIMFLVFQNKRKHFSVLKEAEQSDSALRKNVLKLNTLWWTELLQGTIENVANWFPVEKIDENSERMKAWAILSSITTVPTLSKASEKVFIEGTR